MKSEEADVNPLVAFNPATTAPVPAVLPGMLPVAVLADGLARLLPAVGLVERGDLARPAVEDYIHQRFAREYGARINRFMPYLMVLQSEQQYQAAVGFRLAAESSLFLETYLQRPVEQELANITQLEVKRAGLVEVGNLAATKAGSSAVLFCALSRLLDELGYEWVVISATPTVQNVFSKLSIPLIALAEATLEALPPDQRKRWGSYYESRPLVMAVHVKTAHRCVRESRLGKHMLRSVEPSLSDLIAQWRSESLC